MLGIALDHQNAANPENLERHEGAELLSVTFEVRALAGVRWTSSSATSAPKLTLPTDLRGVPHALVSMRPRRDGTPEERGR